MFYILSLHGTITPEMTLIDKLHRTNPREVLRDDGATEAERQQAAVQILYGVIRRFDGRMQKRWGLIVNPTKAGKSYRARVKKLTQQPAILTK